MECLVNDKKIRLNPYNMKYSEEISTIKGTTSDVYLINNKAYKLYRLPFCSENITKEMITTMKSLKTKRIVLVEDAILNKRHVVIGTISPYIKDLGRNNLLALSKEKFIDEVKFLEEDCLILADKNIKVVDLFLRNFVFNDGMYFIDVGKFRFLDLASDIVSSINKDEFREFFIDRFLIPLVATYTKDKALSSSKIKEDFYGNLRKSISLIETLKEDFTEENLEKYLIKRANVK